MLFEQYDVCVVMILSVLIKLLNGRPMVHVYKSKSGFRLYIMYIVHNNYCCPIEHNLILLSTPEVNNAIFVVVRSYPPPSL